MLGTRIYALPATNEIHWSLGTPSLEAGSGALLPPNHTYLWPEGFKVLPNLKITYCEISNIKDPSGWHHEWCSELLKKRSETQPFEQAPCIILHMFTVYHLHMYAVNSSQHSQLEMPEHVHIYIYMDVSENSGVSPQIIHFNRVFHSKPSNLGYPYFLETPWNTYIHTYFWGYNFFCKFPTKIPRSVTSPWKFNMDCGICIYSIYKTYKYIYIYIYII